MANMEYANLERLTLDTHVLIWYTEGIKLTQTQVDLIENARRKGYLYISAISIWEICMLTSKGKIAFAISLSKWIDQVLTIPGLNLIDLSVPILVQSCELSNYEHKDPADRLIIASTKYINSHLMTFDQKIIAYAAKDYLKVVAINS
jgi:PIN domain nuclease of toxin-antitoxin system